jgi:hypothetical protein
MIADMLSPSTHEFHLKSYSLSFSEPNTNTETVLREATTKIHAKYEFFETTLQIEVYDDEMEACKDCTNPE